MTGRKWGGRPERRFARLILERDGYRCRMMRDGAECGRPATTVQHVEQLAAGGPRFDPLTAVAACEACNKREGGRTRSGRRPPPVALSPGQSALSYRLDLLGVPFDAGTHHTTRLLIAAMQPLPTSADLRAVTAWRTARGPRPAAPSRRW